jgi:hypothetical protein
LGVLDDLEQDPLVNARLWLVAGRQDRLRGADDAKATDTEVSERDELHSVRVRRNAGVVVDLDLAFPPRPTAIPTTLASSDEA